MDKEELELKEQLKKQKKEELERRRQASKQKRSSEPTGLYISNLSLESTTVDSLIDEFSTFGKIKKDHQNNYRCKLYLDENGRFKGDALIIYERAESVQLAIDLINDAELNGCKIKVERAEFNNDKRERIHDKDDSEPPLKRRVIEVSQEKIDTSSRKERTIVLSNILDIYEDIESDELHDLKQDILEGCESFGEVLNITVDSNRGEAHVVFKRQKDALQCCKKMNNRFFDGRKLIAFMLSEEDDVASSGAESTNGENSEGTQQEEDDVVEFT
ncbi:hypothetical protein KAFR_0A08250 [Kazachstania africana CBS 2517]|uniref:RRM domain-containing protein n=1 Tax=Kazachstania africana (strain ATCC 22294 / BCRC 22015 / CBS 2517 / CECT 1963 / NBRC 1671 / NRRL Y-8276) TaxID=1071382 RepID=H2APF9_KAZAF|nr:hypothetical protein KAFR_0A08250 [Kazachstania africana CBS 2517]CCF56259.1 hypothetical protein KAFR_0A08250 [Kazachstania africana CBS 2517]